MVHCSRQDLSFLASLNEANLPGVYILYNDNKRYVGQASKSAYKRICSHDKSKDWWSELVIIGRKDACLDKSQLDFMENFLITECKKANLVLDNITGGNSSHIETYQRGSAQQVLNMGLQIITETLKISILKKTRNRSAGIKKVVALKSITTTETVIDIQDVPDDNLSQQQDKDNDLSTENENIVISIASRGITLAYNNVGKAYQTLIAILAENTHIVSLLKEYSESNNNDLFIDRTDNVVSNNHNYYPISDTLAIKLSDSTEDYVNLILQINEITKTGISVELMDSEI